eukprot:COSAG01_NODE_9_length_43729_cov_66.133463_25_plen_164_part_00
MRILGIDPGYAIVGVAFIEFNNNRFVSLHHSALKTAAKQAISTRILSLADQLRPLLKSYQPEGVAIESLFFNTNTTTAIDVAQARGALLLCCEQFGLSPISFTPLQVKAAVCGYGAATKKQVEYMVQRLYALKQAPKPDDVTDALAVAVCGAYQFKQNRQLKM